MFYALGEYYNVEIREIDFKKVFYDCIDFARRSRIKVPSQLILFGKSLITMEGFCRDLDPSFNLAKSAKPYVNDLIKKNFQPKELYKKGISALIELESTKKSLEECTDELATTSNLLKEREVDVASLQAEQETNVNLIQEKMSQLTDMQVLVDEMIHRTRKAEENYDDLVRNTARSICCKQKIDNDEINYYDVDEDRIVCRSDAGEDLNCW